MKTETRWKLALLVFFVLGALLRLIYVSDMEYKTDEQYMFDRVMKVGKTEPWPWLGVSSGVHIKNPGMSVWVFLALGKLFQVTEPTQLARSVQVLNILALALAIFFVYRFLRSEEHEPWLWGILLACVNPFAILYQRKIWAQSVLPFFSMLFLMSWWKRQTFWGALLWGLIGASLGQIHMSGFFFAFGFFAWALLWDRKGVHWKGWLTGSILGSLTLIPWLIHLFEKPTGKPIFFGWNEAIQLKYWVFWITDSVGLHLGNTLGVKNGNAWHEQLSDFLRYPLVFGLPTYLMAVMHGIALVFSGWILLRALIWTLGSRAFKNWISPQDRSLFTRNAALFGYGLTITLATIVVHRYYLIITFPLEFVWLAQLALLSGLEAKRPGALLRGRQALATLLVAQLLISITFLGYIHVNQGSPQGDYGPSYQSQKRVKSSK